MGFEEHEIA